MSDKFTTLLENMFSKKNVRKYSTRTVSKEDMRENLNMALQRLDDVYNMFITFPTSDRRLMAKKIVSCSSVKSNVACDTYCKVAKMLKKDDLNTAFSSYTIVCLTYRKIVESFLRSIDKWMESSKLTVYSTKLTHVMIGGILAEVKLFCNYTTSMFSWVTYEITQHNNIAELEEPKKYRKMLIVDKMSAFVACCARRLSDNPYAFAADTEDSMKTLDVNVINADGDTNMGFVDTSEIPIALKHSLFVGASGFISSIFRWIGEQWAMHKHTQYLKQRKEKEWLAAHVGLLQMDLSGKDPNSDEYRKLVTIIDAYNEQIAELDQKIAAYEQE